MTSEIKKQEEADFLDLSPTAIQLRVIHVMAEILERRFVQEIGILDESDTELEERLVRYFWVPEFSDKFRKECGDGSDRNLRRDLLEKLQGQNDQHIADIVLQELGYESVMVFLQKNRPKILPVVHMRAIVGQPSTWVHGAVTGCYNRSSKH